MPSTNTSRTTPKNCKHCRQPLPLDRPRLVFCDNNNKCKMAWNRSRNAPVRTRAQIQMTAFRQSAFLNWLIQQARRANTVEVINGDLAELLRIFNLRRRVDGYDSGKPRLAFHIAHIHPVEKDGRLGCIHEHNLFVAPAKMNQHHGRKYYGEGVSLPKTNLRAAFKISDTSTTEEAVERLITCYGKTKIAAFLRQKGITKSLRKAWAYKVEDFLTKRNLPFEHLPLNEQLDLATAHGFGSSKYDADAWSMFSVMQSELQRFIGYQFPYERHWDFEHASLLLERIRPKFESLERDLDGSVYPVDEEAEMLMEDLIRDIYDVLQGKYLLECSLNIWWRYEAFKREQEEKIEARSRAAIAAKAKATRLRNRLKKSEEAAV